MPGDVALRMGGYVFETQDKPGQTQDKVDPMKRIVSALAIALTTLALPAFAQTSKPDVSTPSAQNSGAGVQGLPGNKSGPAARKGTVGSNSATNPDTPSVQDAAKVKGLPGNKSGPSAKPPGSDK